MVAPLAREGLPPRQPRIALKARVFDATDTPETPVFYDV